MIGRLGTRILQILDRDALRIVRADDQIVTHPTPVEGEFFVFFEPAQGQRTNLGLADLVGADHGFHLRNHRFQFRLAIARVEDAEQACRRTFRRLGLRNADDDRPTQDQPAVLEHHIDDLRNLLAAVLLSCLGHHFALDLLNEALHAGVVADPTENRLGTLILQRVPATGGDEVHNIVRQDPRQFLCCRASRRLNEAPCQQQHRYTCP